jgi:hypothetical protein
MSSSQSDVDSDAAYARSLQDEEIRNHSRQFKSNASASSANAPNSAPGSAEPSHNSHPNMNPRSQYAGEGEGGYQHPNIQRPLLARAMGVPGQRQEHRDVHQNAAQQAQQIQENSLPLLTIYCIFGIIEFVLAMVILSKGWDQPCDRPLRTWIILYSARWLLFIPLGIFRFRRRHRVFTERNPDRVMQWQTWLKLLAFVWMIIGQYWYFTSHCDHTSPWLSKFTLAMIIIFYIGLFLPIIILLLMCLCLPCVLILLQIFQTDPGAAPDVIAALPKRSFQPSPDHVGDPPSCAICMEDYKPNEELRLLPQCRHEFHVSAQIQSSVGAWRMRNLTRL